MTHPAPIQRAAAHVEDPRIHATSSGDMTPSSTPPRLQSFTRAYTPGVIDLLAAEGWDTYTVDPARTARALSAPGCTTLLALDGTSVVAIVQLQSDGEIQAHISALLVATAWRRRGLACQLLREALKRAGGIHIDVLTRNSAFYESLGGQPRHGFRLTPEQLHLNPNPDVASAPPRVVAVQPQGAP
jgi:ribosomal protein S18 acetylase RimI-like enzyme